MSGVSAADRARIPKRGRSRLMWAAAGLVIALAGPALAQDGTGAVPDHAEPQRYGGGWVCALGYRVSDAACVAS